MGLLQKLTARFRARKLHRAITEGRVLRGRQPDTGAGNDIVAKADLVPAVTLRVFRAATQEWEDIP